MESQAGIDDKNAAFIACAETIKRLFQTVGIFAICVAGTVVAAAMDLKNLVALLAVLSTPSGIRSFLWLIERRNWFVAIESVPQLVRKYVTVGTILVLTQAIVVVLSLAFGAKIGAMAHLLVYGAEFLVAVAIQYRRISKNRA
ncbi:hypothetical protein [Promicromonospora soli]